MQLRETVQGTDKAAQGRAEKLLAQVGAHVPEEIYAGR